jgi:DnaK suppressor protein
LPWVPDRFQIADGPGRSGCGGGSDSFPGEGPARGWKSAQTALQKSRLRVYNFLVISARLLPRQDPAGADSDFLAPRETMNHNDLEFFRSLLTKMLEEAQQKGDSTLEDMTDSNEVFADPADRATAESDRAFTLRIRDRERRLIRKIQAALQRIDDGTYGVCEDCGEDISIQRLKARPVTRLCINCKARQEEDEHLRGE